MNRRATLRGWRFELSVGSVGDEVDDSRQISGTNRSNPSTVTRKAPPYRGPLGKPRRIAGARSVTTRHNAPTLVSRVLQHPQGATLLFATGVASLYILTRLSLSLFYTPFLVTPDDVGLTYGPTLQVAALSLVAFVATFGLTQALFAAVASPIIVYLVAPLTQPVRFIERTLSNVAWLVTYGIARITQLAPRPRGVFLDQPTSFRRWLQVAAVAVLCWLAAWMLPQTNVTPLPEATGQPRHYPSASEAQGYALLSFIVLVYVLYGDVGKEMLRTHPETVAAFRALRRRLRRLAVVVGVFFLLIQPTVILPLRASAASDGLRAGESESVMPAWVNNALGNPFRADAVIVTSAVSPAVASNLPEPQCALLLGERNSVFVIWQAGRTYRLSAENVTLTSAPTRCPHGG